MCGDEFLARVRGRLGRGDLALPAAQKKSQLAKERRGGGGGEVGGWGRRRGRGGRGSVMRREDLCGERGYMGGGHYR